MPCRQHAPVRRDEAWRVKPALLIRHYEYGPHDGSGIGFDELLPQSCEGVLGDGLCGGGGRQYGECRRGDDRERFPHATGSWYRPITTVSRSSASRSAVMNRFSTPFAVSIAERVRAQPAERSGPARSWLGAGPGERPGGRMSRSSGPVGAGRGDRGRVQTGQTSVTGRLPVVSDR
jgi:hypothetical protein